MKRNSIHNTIHSSVSAIILLFAMISFTGCDTDDPQKEDVPELITKVTLTFTPIGGGTQIVTTATDPDGVGLLPIEVDGAINLDKNTSYTLTLAMINELAASTDPEYDIAAEVEEEAVEHMFFFSWTNDVFSNPAGNGNIDTRNDLVNYEDEDGNGQPLGLTTSWTSTDVTASGTFRVLLKHQPDLKSATSDSSVGETDLDVSFSVNIQ